MVSPSVRETLEVPPAHRPNILFLVHRLPFPPDKGDRIRTFHLLEWLSRRAAVHLACLADEPVPPGTEAALGRYCERVAIIPLRSWSRWPRALGSMALGRTVTEGAFRSPALSAVLRRWALKTPFRAALASASSMVQYLRMDGLRAVPAVVDLIDVDSQKWFDYAESGRGPRSWLYQAEGRRLRRLEQMLPTWARAVTLVSEAEADLLRHFSEPGPIHAVTNGVDLDGFHPRPTDAELGCVFVGALDYHPNVEGASWFCREVWPLVRRRRPHENVSLVGRRPGERVRRLAEQPGVEVVGDVPDVRPHLAASAVVVVPLQIARGVQNKVLEALAMGKAVVASPEALVGLRLTPGVHALVASSPGEWTEAILQLLDDPSLRRRLGAEGRRYVEENHHWDSCLEPMSNLLGLDPYPPSVSPSTSPFIPAGLPMK